jgi:hypothetical protein
MKTKLKRLVFYLTLVAIFGVAAPPQVGGQSSPVIVQPTRVYRFEVSYWDGGHLLTGIYSEGPANNYTFEPIAISIPSGGYVGMYVPPAGYTPDPSSGLVPLHRWTVIQNGWRTYYYYSVYYSNPGSDYHYNGIAGWVFPPQTTQSRFGQPLHQLSVFYSQDLGFWNGYGGIGFGYVEQPPNRPGKRSYVYQGVIASLPPAIRDPQFPPVPDIGFIPSAWDVTFYPPLASPPPPPPPPSGSCNVPLATQNRCAQLGGWWDNASCTCQY